MKRQKTLRFFSVKDMTLKLLYSNNRSFYNMSVWWWVDRTTHWQTGSGEFWLVGLHLSTGPSYRCPKCGTTPPSYWYLQENKKLHGIFLLPEWLYFSNRWCISISAELYVEHFIWNEIPNVLMQQLWTLVTMYNSFHRTIFLSSQILNTILKITLQQKYATKIACRSF